MTWPVSYSCSRTSRARARMSLLSSFWNKDTLARSSSVVIAGASLGLQCGGRQDAHQPPQYTAHPPQHAAMRNTVQKRQGGGVVRLGEADLAPDGAEAALAGIRSGADAE